MVEVAAIRETILNILTNDHMRLTPTDLGRTIRSVNGSARRDDIRQATRELVSQGILTYTLHHSTSHLELNYNRPVPIGERIVLCPSRHTPPTDPDRISIKLQDGTAFGGGDHPTTRLMLQGLDFLLYNEKAVPKRRALDIGTGTGVLAIAAAMLGITRVDAVDIDPAACHEANLNVHLNGAAHFVRVSQNPLDHNSGVKYDLILANLRPPTVIDLIPTMKALSTDSSKWIISGCRLNECKRLKNHLQEPAYRVIWQKEMTGWAAFAIERAGDTYSEK